MQSHTLLISFDDVSTADANRYASELRNDLLDLCLPEVSVELHKDSQDTMDFGSSLILILGTPAIVAIAHGIAVWLSKRRQSKIKIKQVNSDGSSTEIIADAVSPDKVEKIIAQLKTP